MPNSLQPSSNPPNRCFELRTHKTARRVISLSLQSVHRHKLRSFELTGIQPRTPRISHIASLAHSVRALRCFEPAEPPPPTHKPPCTRSGRPDARASTPVASSYLIRGNHCSALRSSTIRLRSPADRQPCQPPGGAGSGVALGPVGMSERSGDRERE